MTPVLPIGVIVVVVVRGPETHTALVIGEGQTTIFIATYGQPIRHTLR